jgi:hypothetical protein
MSVDYRFLERWRESQVQQRSAREGSTDEYLKRLLTIVDAPVPLRPTADFSLLMLVAEDR